MDAMLVAGRAMLAPVSGGSANGNGINKRRRVALGDRTNKDVDAPKKAAKKAVKKKNKRSPTTGGAPAAANLPDGWIAEVSRASGETYYRNSLTDEAQWDVPDEKAVDTRPAIKHVHETLQQLGAAGLRVIECALMRLPPVAWPPEPVPRHSVRPRAPALTPAVHRFV